MRLLGLISASLIFISIGFNMLYDDTWRIIMGTACIFALILGERTRFTYSSSSVSNLVLYVLISLLFLLISFPPKFLDNLGGYVLVGFLLAEVVISLED